MMLRAVLALAVCLPLLVVASCPNGCSGHGKCNRDQQCECYKEGIIINPTGNDGTLQSAWTGADCSRMRCPRGKSWVESDDRSAASASNHGQHCDHKLGVECSEKGLCDRTTGQCKCFPGYSGAACQRTECPNSCSGHGICQSNVKFAQDATVKMQPYLFHKDGLNAEFSYLVSYDEAWDSGMHFGCKCDVGYRGPDCSLVECPSGDDPMEDENFCQWDLAVTEFVDATWFFSQSSSNGIVNPQMLPLPNRFLLYVEDYVNVDVLHAKSDDFDAEPFVNGKTACSNLHGAGQDAYKTISVSPTASSVYPFYTDSEGKHYQLASANVTKLSLTADADYRSNVMNSYQRCVQHRHCGGSTSGEPCSGRGLCNYGDGTCKCFHGYAGENCGTVEDLM